MKAGFEIVRLFFILAIALFLSCGRAQAAESFPYTSTERAGFAFYKLGNVNPDFLRWIEVKEAYQKAWPRDRLNMMKSETARLEDGFYNYQADRHYIRVMADTVISRNDKEGVITLSLEDVAYFPFQVADMWIGAFPRGIDDYRTLELPPQDYGVFIKKAGIAGVYNKNAPGVIELWLKPVAAETQKPLETGEMVLWPLICEIGSITLWDGTRQVMLWSYQAPGFITESGREIFKLYHE